MQKALRESRYYSAIALNNSSDGISGGAGCSGSGGASGSSGSGSSGADAGASVDGNEEVHVEPRYPRRSRPRVDYAELETPDDDHFLCE